jgi:hypothetical protein
VSSIQEVEMLVCALCDLGINHIEIEDVNGSF